MFPSSITVNFDPVHAIKLALPTNGKVAVFVYLEESFVLYASFRARFDGSLESFFLTNGALIMAGRLAVMDCRPTDDHNEVALLCKPWKTSLHLFFLNVR